MQLYRLLTRIRARYANDVVIEQSISWLRTVSKATNMLYKSDHVEKKFTNREIFFSEGCVRAGKFISVGAQEVR